MKILRETIFDISSGQDDIKQEDELEVIRFLKITL